ncbi:Lactoylglutathione lyase [Xylogone sp. PMI_703]|nr:Lactoylglutathione lyase [Xylogone sp. PMI_703]
MPIAHILIRVAAAEHAKAVAFYTAALKPLGYGQLASFGSVAVGLGIKSPEWWIKASDVDADSKVHVAFTAPDRASVDAFYAAALEAGGKDNGPPGLRPHYHPNCYSAFVFDPAGNNIEAVCMAPEDSAK